MQKAIEIDPEYVAAHGELGVLFQKEGDLEKGEYNLRRPEIKEGIARFLDSICKTKEAAAVREHANPA